MNGSQKRSPGLLLGLALVMLCGCRSAPLSSLSNTRFSRAVGLSPVPAQWEPEIVTHSSQTPKKDEAKRGDL